MFREKVDNIRYTIMIYTTVVTVAKLLYNNAEFCNHEEKSSNMLQAVFCRSYFVNFIFKTNKP